MTGNVDNAEIGRLLTEKGADRPCQRCGAESFAVIDKFAYIHLQDDLSQAIRLGGPAIPVVVTVCENCGAVNLHAVAALGLMPGKEDAEGDHD